MTSSRRPLLILLLSFLIVMLWQAWVYENVGKKDGNINQSGENSLIKDKKNGNYFLPIVKNEDNIYVNTDIIRIQINKNGGIINKVDLFKYPNSLGSDAPFSLLDQSRDHMYVAQTGFQGDGDVIFSSDKESYVLEDGEDKLSVTLKGADKRGVVYEKVFIFYKGMYNFDIISKVNNRSLATWRGAHYSRFVGSQDSDVSQGKIPQAKDFNIDPDAPKPGMFTFSTYQGPAYYSDTKPYTKYSFAKMAQKPVSVESLKPSWIAIQQRYFLCAWIPKGPRPYITESSWQSGDVPNKANQYRQTFNFSMRGGSLTLSPGESTQVSTTFYAGPELVDRLRPLAQGLELTVDYGWLWFISDVLFKVMDFTHKYLGNWGAAIIMTTLIVKLVFYKMSEASYRTMALQRKLQPRIDAISKRYEKEPEEKNKAILELYQKESIHPLNGCLPTIIQMPFFFALYYVLIESIQLRLSPFLWVPDLASKDPFYILPLLLGICMIATQKISPKQADSAQQSAMMVVPVMMTFLFSQFPAGLVLYWLTNNLLSFLQQWTVMRKYNAI